jgi:hypothetical protein
VGHGSPSVPNLYQGASIMRTITMLVTTILLGSASAAFAGPKCSAPKDQWMKESDFRAMVEKKGYQINKFKVSSGQCYEIYGRDANGKKVEIYFDPATGNEVKRKD